MSETFDRRVLVTCHEIPCGYLAKRNGECMFTYFDSYTELYRASPISLTMPVRPEPYRFDHFPPFFDGLLPEGGQLEALVRQNKIDAYDYMSQLEAVGADLVGAVTVLPDPRKHPQDQAES